MAKKSKLFAVLALCWGLFIFLNSLQNGTTSTQMSDAVVFRLPGFLSFLDVDALTVLVRKTAHFSEYALLGGLASLAFHHSGGLRWGNLGNLLFPCLLWAVLDEFIQTFVEGRTGLVADVLIDFGGIAAGCAVVALILFLIQRRKRKGGRRCAMREPCSGCWGWRARQYRNFT